MQLINHFASLLSLSLISQVSTSPVSRHAGFTTHEHHQKIAADHLAIFSGEYSLINQTWMPNIHLYQDRNPGPKGSVDLNITNSTAYLSYVEHFRYGFSPLTISQDYMLSSAYKVAIRWTLESVADANITLSDPGTTLKPGDKVSYNGTDILLLDCETGLVSEVDSAFDIIDYEYQVGEKTINVG